MTCTHIQAGYSKTLMAGGARRGGLKRPPVFWRVGCILSSVAALGRAESWCDPLQGLYYMGNMLSRRRGTLWVTWVHKPASQSTPRFVFGACQKKGKLLLGRLARVERLEGWQAAMFDRV
jgi:hypothetical protein